MKTAIYIEDGIVQLVLTPENKFEKDAVSSFSKGKVAASIFEGGFYDCRGGWTRQKAYYPQTSIYGGDSSEDRSIILRAVASEPILDQSTE